MDSIKLFGKYESSGVVINDITLRDHINIRPIIVPNTGGRHTKKRFWKSKLHIVERLMNKLMVTGHMSAGKKHLFTSGRNAGKKHLIYTVVEEAFDIINEKEKKNPIQVLVEAIENSAPKTEITSIEFGGIRHPVGVDTAPQRRVDLALSYLTKGAKKKSVKSKTSVATALATELILASKGDNKSFAIEKKDNLEKQAEASR